MKHFAIILVLCLSAAITAAQDFEPLMFSMAFEMPGYDAKTLKSRAFWLTCDLADGKSSIPDYSNTTYGKTPEFHCAFWGPKEKCGDKKYEYACFYKINIVCKDGAYSVTMSDIRLWAIRLGLVRKFSDTELVSVGFDNRKESGDFSREEIVTVFRAATPRIRQSFDVACEVIRERMAQPTQKEADWLEPAP